MSCAWMGDFMIRTYFPGIAYRFQKDYAVNTELWTKAIFTPMPVVYYCMTHTEGKGELVTESDYEQLLLLEGSDEKRRGIAEEELAYDADSLHLDKSLQDAMQKENQVYREQGEYVNGDDAKDNRRMGETQNPDKEKTGRQEQINDTKQDVGAEHNDKEQNSQEESDKEQDNGFIPAKEKAYSYDWSRITDYDELVKAFYAVDSTTSAPEKLFNIETLKARDMTIQKDAQEPQILIYHTHSQEAFADSIEGDPSTSIVGAGEYLTELLTEQYGYQVIHHTGGYDVEARDYAYSKALPALEAILEEYPSIQVVIDLHRDEMREGKKLCTIIQGKPMAQFMFFNGMSRTRKGPIDYLENPYLADNLALSFQMQVATNEYYPGITRRIYLKAYRYNMHVCPKTLLIELGAQTNTVEEIWNSCEVLAHVLDLVLSGEAKP